MGALISHQSLSLQTTVPFVSSKEVEERWKKNKLFQGPISRSLQLPY